MEARLDCLMEKVEILEKTIESFKKEFVSKMKIVEHILISRNDRLNIRKESLEQELSINKFMLSSWSESSPPESEIGQTRSGFNCDRSNDSKSTKSVDESIPTSSIIYEVYSKNADKTYQSTFYPDATNSTTSESSSVVECSTSANGAGLVNGQQESIELGIDLDNLESPTTSVKIEHGNPAFRSEAMDTMNLRSRPKFDEEIISISDSDDEHIMDDLFLPDSSKTKSEQMTDFEDAEITQTDLNEDRPPDVGRYCQICGSYQKSLASLKSHISKEHRNLNLGFICHFCGKQFGQLTSLNDHKRIHLEGIRHQCNICPDIKFNTLQMLVSHMKTVHDIENQICKVCGKDFSGPSYLKRHMYIFHNELAERSPTSVKRNKKCSLCPKSYQTRADLLVHIRSHTGEKPYSCSGCQKPFADIRNLKRHYERFPNCKTVSSTNQSVVNPPSFTREEENQNNNQSILPDIKTDVS